MPVLLIFTTLQSSCEGGEQPVRLQHSSGPSRPLRLLFPLAATQTLSNLFLKYRSAPFFVTLPSSKLMLPANLADALKDEYPFRSTNSG